MHAPNTSSRLAAAVASAAPAIPPMSQNVPKCPTFSPKPAAGPFNSHASDNVTTRHPHLARLSPQQTQAIDLMIRGHCDSHIAAEVGVDRRTLHRWKNHHPAFIAALNFRQQQLLNQAALRYRRSLRKSFKIVNAAMDKPDSPDAIRVALALINGTTGRKALNQEIGPTNPIAVVNAMAAEEQRLLEDTYSGSEVHQEMSDRLAQLDQFLQKQEAA
jgi:hypothetical protein